MRRGRSKAPGEALRVVLLQVVLGPGLGLSAKAQWRTCEGRAVTASGWGREGCSPGVGHRQPEVSPASGGGLGCGF